ncbi:CocE/NonD family hydrolase [Leptolyngbya sp. AN02str]|uniref:CocE/NonD family hydrolase n=1 Tax=Leptolyngbya sp. AN02str TaxID=3423363 RepID=UPI003D321156
MQTRDGVRLDADVYYPNVPGEFPVLLMRQPYGRAIASTVVYAHPQWYAAQGFIVVIQDVRGRGSSAGEFHLFAHELEDGYDTVQWAAQLPRSTGEVGMYGFSYQGMTQLYAAAAKPPALKTICPSMVAYDLYADWAYEGGAFCYQMNLGWALQLACETARRDGDEQAYRELYAAAHSLSFPDPVCPRSDILERLAPDSFYHDWLGNPDPTSSYWTTLSPQTFLGDVDLPMLHIGGWFDTHLRGTLRLYRAIAPRSQHPQHLWVGPWAHLPWGRRVGNTDYGSQANSPMDVLQVQWFNQFLKGKDTGILQQAPVHLFDLGKKQWREFETYPPDAMRSLHLLSDGLAMMGDQHGELVSDADGDAPALPDVLVHDPWRPVPAMGGHATIPTGPCDRFLLDSRTDVATYTTEPLVEYWSIVGEPVVELYCSADAPSFDLCAVLSEVMADGRVIYISQGYLRVDLADVGAIAPHQITLQPTCITLLAGSALRLSISGACFPAYAMNPGTGTEPYDSRLIEARVITITIAAAELGRSRLMLPHIFSAAAR